MTVTSILFIPKVVTLFKARKELHYGVLLAINKATLTRSTTSSNGFGVKKKRSLGYRRNLSIATSWKMRQESNIALKSQKIIVTNPHIVKLNHSSLTREESYVTVTD